MEVKDLISHILLHVNGEDATRDSSQVAGVAARAQYVRDTVDGFKTDTRDLSLDMALAEISGASSLSALQLSFKRAVANTRAERDTRPQLAIQTWVAQNRETRG